MNELPPNPAPISPPEPESVETIERYKTESWLRGYSWLRQFWSRLTPSRQRDARLIAMMLAIKTLCFVFAVQSYHVWQDQPVNGWRGWLEIWNRWDALHYLKLAQQGYSAVGEMRPSMVFYPLYPWLIHFVTYVSRDFLLSAFLISTVASIAVGLLLFRLIAFDHSAELAERTVWFLFIFPTSYFLHIGYTESLFLALALGCLLAARRQDWPLAGFLGAFACLARGPGIVLIPALAVEAFCQYRAARRWQWQWLWIVEIAAGFGVYLWLNAQVAGDPFAFVQIRREHFYIAQAWPWVGINQTIGALNRNPAGAEMSGMQELIFIALGLIGVVAAWIKLRPVYSVWMTLNWLLVISVTFVASVPRYTVVMFPLHLLFARLAMASRFWEVVLTVWSLLYLALFSSAFVRGFWAF